MIVINSFVKLKFDFLKSEGFHLESEIENKIVYQSKKASLILTFNERDGFDSVLLAENKEISITTVLGVINTYRGMAIENGNKACLDHENVENEISQVAIFLKTEGKKILKGHHLIIGHLEKIRFWHVGNWINKWGKTIEMTPSEIEQNHELIKRIVDLLK